MQGLKVLDERDLWDEHSCLLMMDFHTHKLNLETEYRVHNHISSEAWNFGFYT